MNGAQAQITTLKSHQELARRLDTSASHVFPELSRKTFGLRGGFNGSAQHLLVLLDREVSAWNGRLGYGLRRNRRPSCGSAGRAANVWQTSPARLEGGTRVASTGYSLSMGALHRYRAEGFDTSDEYSNEIGDALKRMVPRDRDHVYL